MVAIVLSRIIICDQDIGLQWQAEELTDVLNELPYSSSADFHVDSTALKHGLCLFKKFIQNRGVNTIEMFQKERGLQKYFSLTESRRSVELKFIASRRPDVEACPNEILKDIILIRDDITKQYKYEKSIYSSPSSIFIGMHMPLVFKTPAEEKDLNKIRKSPSELCLRSISNHAKKLLESTEKEYGEEHAVFYLNSAIKKLESKKRKAGNIDNDSEKALMKRMTGMNVLILIKMKVY